MSRVYVAAPGAPFARARLASVTSAGGFTAPAPTTTKPTGDGIVDLSQNPPAWVRVTPFGTGTKGQTFDVRVIGWTLVNATSAGGALWVPVILCQFTATIGAAVGVAGAAVTALENFADTVSAPATNLGASGVDCQPKSPQNDTPAHYLIDGVGCMVFEIDVNVGTATAGNALVGAA